MNNLFNSHTQYGTKDAASLVLGFLDYNGLNAMREVNKDCQSLLDESKLYQAPWDSFKNKFAGLLNSEAKAQTTLDTRKMSWLGYFASKINFQSGILSIITKIFCLCFSSIKNEINEQNKLAKEIADLSDSRKKLLKEFKIEREKLGALDKMQGVFSGKDEYDSFPILDIGNRRGSTDYIDFIKHKEMTAPIMKGQDSLGRRFIALRLEDKDDQIQTVLTFFERYTDAGSWAYGGSGTRYMDLPGYLLNRGRENKEDFSKFVEFIKNRGNDRVAIK